MRCVKRPVAPRWNLQLLLGVFVGLLCVSSAPNAPAAPFEPGKRPIDVTAKVEVDSHAGLAVLKLEVSGMVAVSGGRFEMGAGPVAQSDAFDHCKREPLGFLCRPELFAVEGPRREVTLSAFAIDRTEVTVEAYQRCVGAAMCAAVPIPTGDLRFDRPELPVTHITWDEATRYCAFRGARLPTEAEWERAARGIAGRAFPWGNAPNPNLCNHGAVDVGAIVAKIGMPMIGTADPSDGFTYLAPVGKFPAGATPDGIHDLAGNVAEWVADVFDYTYPPGPVTNPKGPSSGVLRGVRGGSFKQPMSLVRGASRSLRLASARDPDIGFRCARDL